MNQRVTNNIKAVMLFMAIGIHALATFRTNNTVSYPLWINDIELFLRPCINILFIITGVGFFYKYNKVDYKYFLNKFIYFTIESIVLLLLLNIGVFIFDLLGYTINDYFSPWFLFTYILIPLIFAIFKLVNFKPEKYKNIMILLILIPILLTFSTTNHTGALPYPFRAFEYLPFAFIGFYIMPKILKKFTFKHLIISGLYIVLSIIAYNFIADKYTINFYLYNLFYQYFSIHVLILTFIEFILFYKLFEILKKIKLNLPTLEMYIVSGFAIGLIDAFLFDNSILNKDYHYIIYIWILGFFLSAFVGYFIKLIYKNLYSKYMNKVIEKL